MPKGKAKKNIMVEVIQPLLNNIDIATGPKEMSHPDAIDALEIIIDKLKSRIEALREELGNEHG